MKAAKRLLFVVAFVPFAAYVFLRWLATGKSAVELLWVFEQWRDE